jgi:hypothetical protein
MVRMASPAVVVAAAAAVAVEARIVIPTVELAVAEVAVALAAASVLAAEHREVVHLLCISGIATRILSPRPSILVMVVEAVVEAPVLTVASVALVAQAA